MHDDKTKIGGGKLLEMRFNDSLHTQIKASRGPFPIPGPNAQANLIAPAGLRNSIANAMKSTVCGLGKGGKK
jgi:hypothetical protein